MKEVRISKNDTKEAKEKTKYQKILRSKYNSHVYPEFSSPIGYIRYKMVKAATA